MSGDFRIASLIADLSFFRKAREMETRFYQAQGLDIQRIATELERMFLMQGYQVQHFGNQDQVTVQLKKGGDFAAIVGMQTALTVTMQRSPGGVMAMLGQQKWADKAAVGVVGMLVLWPLAFTAGAGAIQQANLANQVINALDMLVRQQAADVQFGPIPPHMMPQYQQPGAPPAPQPPYPPQGQQPWGPPGPPPPQPPQNYQPQWGPPQPYPPPAQQQQWAPPIPPTVVAPSSAKVTCPKCHTANDADNTYCLHCGNPLQAQQRQQPAQVQQKKLCPRCGAEMKPDATFCTKCGTSFSPPEERTVAVDVTPPTQYVAPGATTTWGYLLFTDGTRMDLAGERVSVGRYLPEGGGSKPDMNLYSLPESHTVSRMHAAFTWTDNNSTLTDLNSTNGTFLNGQRLEPDKPVPVNDGDAVLFGKVGSTFKKA